MTLFNRIAVVGVGLLGGSLGLAARDRELCDEVVGIRRSKASIDEAKRIGAIDVGYTTIAQGVREADLVVMCSPVRQIKESLAEVVAAVRPGTIITDVGSTKTTIVAAGEAATEGTGASFVGSHPMAGSEKSGVRYSSATLYDGCTCFVTKTDHTALDAFSKVCALWEALGCRVVISRPARHDELVSLVSHLPHLAAVALVQAVDSFKEDKNLIKGIIGNGFRDMTRLAGGSTELWQDICSENKTCILEMCERFEHKLRELTGTVETSQEQSLQNLLDSARAYREFVQNR